MARTATSKNMTTTTTTNTTAATSNTATTMATISPVSFTEAMQAHDNGTTAQTLFSNAHEWGNTQAIPESALRIVWPETCYSDDKMQSYLNAVYFIQFCALEYYANASNQTIAEEWRTKGMAEWGNVLDMVGCEYKRDATDWLYLVSRATIDGKQDRDSKRKVTKASTQKAFRKRVEMLVGMALHGFVFVNTMDSVESYKEGRKAKAEKAAAKAAKVAEKAAKAAEKTANEPAPPIMGGIEKPAAKKQAKAKTTTKKAKPAPEADKADNLQAVDNLFNGLEIPELDTLAGVAI